MKFLKQYNQEVTLVCFSLGMFFYAFGLLNFGKSFGIQTFFHIGILIFIIFSYSLFQKTQWRVMIVPALCFAVVCVLGFISFTDDTLNDFTLSQKFKSFNTQLLGLFILFIAGFVYAAFARAKYLKFLFIFIIFLCIFVVFASIYEWAMHSFVTHREPLFFFHIIATNIWLFGAAAFALSGIFFFTSFKFKILSAIILALTFLAIIGNGERSFLLGFIAMILASFVVWRYKFKKYILVLISCIAILIAWGIYSQSKVLPDRYNIGHFIDNFSLIWNTPPIEMGQYDKSCFAGASWPKCALQSLEQGKNKILFEHSALTRLAMYKSAIHLIAQEPFKPHIIGATNVGSYLHTYYDFNDPYRIYIDNSAYDQTYTLYGFNHIHSTPLSLCVEYGIFGFLMILCFHLFLFYLAYKGSRRFQDSILRFVCLGMMIFLIGLWVQAQFDIFYSINLQPLFLIFGLFLGFYVNRNYDENSANNQ